MPINESKVRIQLALVVAITLKLIQQVFGN
jgi:hypothetical protein